MAQHTFKFLFGTNDKGTVAIVDRSTNGVLARIDPVIEDPETGELLDGDALRSGGATAKWHRWCELAMQPYVQGQIVRRSGFRGTVDVPEGGTRPAARRLPRRRASLGLPRRRGAEYAVETYLRTMEELHRRSREGPDKRGARLAWSVLRDARVFSVPHDLASGFVSAWLECGDVEEGALADALGSTRVAPPEPDWPERFPFSSVWLGYDGALEADYDQGCWEEDIDVEAIERANLFGHLLTAGGDYWTVLQSEEADEIGIFRTRSREEGWLEPVEHSELGPLVVEYVNQQRTFIIETEVPGLRRRMKMSHKALGIKGKRVAPPPYYRIRVRSKVIKEVAQRKADGMPATYRHDVRAHERCRIRRGPLPMPTAMREKLEDADYDVFFSPHPVDTPTLARLADRRIRPKRPDEWLAIKVMWIESHISPSDDTLPYVPANRDLSR